MPHGFKSGASDMFHNKTIVGYKVHSLILFVILPRSLFKAYVHKKFQEI
jgi:hypothetical protein